jgi:hypothetical protein
MTDVAIAPVPREPELSDAVRFGLAVLFAALICIRLPAVVWNGRFYAEEGEFFFAYAWHMPWDRALLHNLGGYLNIVASGSTLLLEKAVRGGWISLENAPYFTEAIALSFQVCPAILVLTSRADWLRPWWAPPLALLIMATPPLTEQVWLQTLHSQFHLALCAGLILATETVGALALRAFRIVLLVLGPLCGPATIVLAPFFVLRALIERSRERWLQTAALLAASAVQLLMFYAPSGERGYHIDPLVLASVMSVRHIALPLLGAGFAASLVAHPVQAALEAGVVPWTAVAACLIVFGGLTLAALARWREAPVWLLIPALTLAGVSYFGAIHGGARLLTLDWATRYSYVPLALAGLSLIAFANTFRGAASKVFLALSVWIGFIGAIGYAHPLHSLSEGPDWRKEVAAWRVDPEHRLASWPKGGWLIDLSPNDAPCPADIHAPDQPDYCDGYWEKL